MWIKKAIELFQNGMSLRQIEKEICINRKIISRELKNNGIQTLKKIDKKLVQNMLNDNKSIAYIATNIGVDQGTLSKFITNNRIKNNRQRRSLRNSAQDEKIILLYNSGESIDKISKLLSVSTNKIWNCLLANNIDTTRKYRKYSLNETVFETINTEAKAYWLGFLYADGYVNNQRGVELSLKESDLNHLEKFKLFLNTDSVITYKKELKAYSLKIYSVKLSRDLTKLGCHQNKSLTLEFPTEEQVPRHLIHHFMRGYFDGDGCVCIGQNQMRFSIIGTHDFIDKYDDILMNAINRTNKNKYGRCGRAYELRRGGNLQCKSIYDFLYKDAEIYLTRKYDYFAVLRQKSLKP